MRSRNKNGPLLIPSSNRRICRIFSPPRACGDLKGAFYVVLAFDFAEIEILVSRTGRLPVVGRPNRLKER
jgi:hypothetical protein